jgi:NADPH2:quinone reductase
MKAFVVEEFDSEPRLREDLPDPQPGEGELAVRVHASSVSPVDNSIAGGMLRGMYEHEFPVVLGRDFAGVVQRVGPSVDRYEVGEEVLGFVLHADPTVHFGTWAELAIVPADGFVTRKPAGVDFGIAGAAPLSTLTAIDAVKALALGDGDTVLIVGATGGVGSASVQLAKRAGARIIAPGWDEDQDYLADLGVDRLIPRDGDVATAVRELEPDGVSGLLDAVSMQAEALEAFVPALADGARIVSTAGAAGEGEGRHNAMGSADTGEVATVAKLLEDGALRVPIQRTYGLEEAGTALADLPGKHTTGKLAIAVGP